jgi:hypothetical protein
VAEAAMFALGYQELLIVLVLLVIVLFVQPFVTYLIAALFLKVLRLSPRRALLGFWLLAVVCAALMYIGNRDMNLFIGTVILAPVGIALNVGWLWLTGCIWQRLSLFRVGTAWRNTAVLLFRATAR